MMNDSDWPGGAVTFLFSDIEDSTPLWDRHRMAMRAALAEHDALLETAVRSNGGVIVKTTGDGAMAAFASPSAALAAALDAQRALRDAAWPTITPDKIRVRIGLHTGEAEQRAGDYYGTAVNRAARLMSIGHGGQTLISGRTTGLIESSLPDGTNLLDLGEHRLKGLSQTAHVYQVETSDLPHQFPPLNTGETQKGNLPQQLTSFVGREQELANVERQLGEGRLVTLTGPGGTGKTRLSLETGRRVEGIYDHGVWLVELAPLSDEDLVPATVAGLFDLREQPGVTILTALSEYLRDKKLLLILDNCEHLVSACARLAAELLPAAPRLTILASSREGLSVPGEMTVHVPALGIPTRDINTRDELAQFEAVRLFVTRARVVKPGFELLEANCAAVGQIVRRLDGIPLAIELAAARVKLLSPAQIAERLDNRFRLLTGGSRTALPRQQTLRALIDWSYDLLTEEERWFFRQMAVFSGGWTLEAAEYVVGAADLETGFLDALDLLANLVNKSLVTIDDSSDEIRYRTLETIRQYARDRLFEAGEGPAARDVHFNYFSQLANDGSEGNMESFGDIAHQERLEQDLDNLRAALDWGTATDPEAASDLLRYLSPLWTMLALSREAIDRSEALLDALAELPPAEEGGKHKRQLAQAFGLSVFAMGSTATGGSRKGYAAAKEAAAIFRKDESLSRLLADILFWQAILGIEIGQAEGYAAAQECCELGRRLNDQVRLHVGLVAMARWEYINGDMAAAAEHLVEASQLKAILGIPTLVAYQAYTGSLIARASGDYEAAHQILAEGVEALQQARHRIFANVLDSELGHTHRQSGDLAGAAEIYRHTIREWQDLGHRAAVANQLECFAFMTISEKRFDRAARLLGAAETLRESLTSSMTPVEKKEYEDEVVDLREAMSAGELEGAWQAGRELDLESAVALALVDYDPSS